MSQLYTCLHVCVCVSGCVFSHSIMSNSLWSHGLQPTRLLCPWDFPGKNTGVGCHFLLQGTFSTQGSNLHLLCLLHCWQILYHWATGSQRTVENSSRDGNTRPPYLPPEKSICRSRSTVRTGHGTTDWFQIGKGVHQSCILSPCLFNLYAEYIMRNARLEEAQAGIKIAGRNINNLRYADDHPYDGKQRRTKDPLDESERGEWKSWFKTQHSKN